MFSGPSRAVGDFLRMAGDFADPTAFENTINGVSGGIICGESWSPLQEQGIVFFGKLGGFFEFFGL